MIYMIYVVLSITDLKMCWTKPRSQPQSCGLGLEVIFVSVHTHTHMQLFLNLITETAET